MGLRKHHVIALKSFDGIGNKKLFKIGNYIKENNIKISSSKDLVRVLDILKIKVQKDVITTEMLENAISAADRIIKMHDAAGIGITTYFDEDFPVKLRDTINEEGKLDPPMILYYKGDLSITQMPCLAIIGTREITDFGIKAGEYLSKEFIKRGFCIVSGLAIGCDTIGHKGAVENGGKTIAFLAHGLDTIYPQENKTLAQKIIETGGLLISEYPIGITVNRYNLVARDRLQAGMSLATLVIQTGENGGTMHAANTTLKAQKPLYAVRFQDIEHNEHEKSKGNALLVKKGGKYIAGGDNLDIIKDNIISSNTPKTLF